MPVRSSFFTFAIVLLEACSVIVNPDPSLLGGEGTLADAAAPIVDAPMDSLPDTPGECVAHCDGRVRVTCEGTMAIRTECSEQCDPRTAMCVTGPDVCDQPPVCNGDRSFACRGDEVVPTFCADGCNSDTGLCKIEGDFVPSNLGVETFVDDAPDVALESSAMFDTTICVSASGSARHLSMNDGGRACVLIVGDFEIADSARLTVTGSLPLIVIASGDVIINGAVDVSADHDHPGPGGFVGGTLSSVDGSGRGAGAHGEGSGRSDAGGGGAGGRSRGGDGGDAVSGFAGEGVPGGVGGPAWATDYTGEPLFGGAGGGGGDGEGHLFGGGGAGGGALQISARGNIEVNGVLRAGGGGGIGGGRGDFGTTDSGAGGGGGAGGTVLLEAREIEITGDISVAGGGGGSPAGSGGRADGQDGPSRGIAEGGQTNRSGGNGAGDADSATSGDDARVPGSNAGGGGGGGGVIILRAESRRLNGSLNPREAPIERPL